MALSDGGTAFDWFFVAIAKCRIGLRDEARTRHAKALAWMEANRNGDQELRRFCGEAAALLGLK